MRGRIGGEGVQGFHKQGICPVAAVVQAQGGPYAREDFAGAQARFRVGAAVDLADDRQQPHGSFGGVVLRGDVRADRPAHAGCAVLPEVLEGSIRSLLDEPQDE